MRLHWYECRDTCCVQDRGFFSLPGFGCRNSVVLDSSSASREWITRTHWEPDRQTERQEVSRRVSSAQTTSSFTTFLPSPSSGSLRPSLCLRLPSASRWAAAGGTAEEMGASSTLLSIIVITVLMASRGRHLWFHSDLIGCERMRKRFLTGTNKVPRELNVLSEWLLVQSSSVDYGYKSRDVCWWLTFHCLSIRMEGSYSFLRLIDDNTCFVFSFSVSYICFSLFVARKN